MIHQARMRIYALGSAVMLSLAMTVGCTSSEPRTTSEAPRAAGEKTTLDNLQAAYEGESNAHAKYVAFAEKADADGYGQVASLFRAAAKAENIHASNHAEVIKKMGATPTATIKPAAVAATTANLQAAIDGETYERDTMYPSFIKKARADGLGDAVRTMNFALGAEVEHAKLYSEALGNIDGYRGGARTYYVCPVCGYTTADASFANCPSCMTPKEKFLQMS